jgi:hypothetical protein
MTHQHEPQTQLKQTEDGPARIIVTAGGKPTQPAVAGTPDTFASAADAVEGSSIELQSVVGTILFSPIPKMAGYKQKLWIGLSHPFGRLMDRRAVHLGNHNTVDPVLRSLGFGPQVSTGVADFELILSWLQLCHTQHANICQPKPIQKDDRLRFIDVTKRCLEVAPPHFSFVALSYV